MSDVAPRRRRFWPIVVVAAIVLILLATRIATFYTDALWFSSVDFSEIFWTSIGFRVGVGVIAGLVVAAVVAGNLLLARRLAPTYRIPSPAEEVIERYRQILDPFAKLLSLGVGLVIGALSGISLSAQWEQFLLFLNRVPFGMEDPQFGRDVSYFVFELPVYELINSWLFTTLVFTIVLTAAAHYVFGGLRPQAAGARVAEKTVVHLSLLLAAVVGVRAWGFVLDQHLLSYSDRGFVTGLSYTDVNAQLLAYQVLAIISAAVVVLFLVNIRLRRWQLPTAGLALLVVAGLVLAGIYPTVIQRVQVAPQQLEREREFIDRNLEMTRYGFGIELDEVERSSFEANSELDDAEVADNSTTLESVRLWDPATLQNTYQQTQVFRTYYDFNNVDVDRYTIDDELQQVMLSVRELNEFDIPENARTWQNLRMLYTHGYGVAASDVSVTRDDGQPLFLQENIPPEGVDELETSQPRVYFGELSPEYSIVNAAIDEFDYPQLDEEGRESELYRYTGDDGVAVGSIGRRLAFALRYAEPNFLLSSLIESDSEILFNRNIRERVEAVAPYLAIDHDPYAVVTDDSVKWILDAYTTTDMLPYSQQVDLGPLTQAEQRQLVTVQNAEGELELQERTVEVDGIEGTANYIRNSVKAVVDAYDGSIDLVVVDDEDPVLGAWRNAFPDHFTDIDDVDEDLVAHFRYPEDLFRVQASMFERYHIPEADDFYSGEDIWATPIDAAFSQNQGGSDEDRPMRPYYLLMRLPGEEEEEFALIQPFTPADRPNLIGWLAGRSDGENYGQLRAYLMPPDQTVFGPQQAQARIDQDGDVAQQITLWNQSGARVIYGNLLVIPVEDSLLYAQPLFLRAEQSEIPELARVVLVFGDQVIMEDTLAESMLALFGEAASGVAQDLTPEEVDELAEAQADPDADVEDGEAFDPQVMELIEEALEAFANGEEALREGDLGAFSEFNREGQELLTEASRLSGGTIPEFPEPADVEEDDVEDDPDDITDAGDLDDVELDDEESEPDGG